MKISMLSIGSIGDVRPFTLLGKELKSRGHEITIAAFPQFRETVLASGLAFFPLNGNAGKMINAVMQPDTNGLTYLPRLLKNFGQTIPDLIQSMTDSCIGSEAMICNYFGSVYYSIAELYNIPCFQVHYFPMDPTAEFPISSVRNQHMSKPFNLASYKIGYFVISMVEKHFLSSWRKGHLLSQNRSITKPDYTAGSRSVPVLYAISPSFLQRPKEWNNSIHMCGFFLDDLRINYRPSTSLLHFMEKGAAPVYIGFGSMNAGNMNKLLTIILKAICATGIRAIIFPGDTCSHQSSGDQIYFVSEFVPHDWIFPRVSAVIHHGGAGTTATGLRHGKPTLIIPFAGDQPFWGNLVARTGCGPQPLFRKNLSVHKLAQRMKDLISNPLYREKAAEMSIKIKEESGIQTAADIIEKEITGVR